MTNINLLPWRDEFRQEKKREFLSMLALLCVLGALVAYGWISFTKASIENQQQRNTMLEQEIASLEEKVKEIQGLQKRREQLEIRIRIIQDLQIKRPLVVRYFDEMVRAVPEGLYLKTITREGNQINLEGVTKSNNRISTLMRNLDRSPWFEVPNLRNVIGDEFELSVDAVVSEPESNREG